MGCTPVIDIPVVPMAPMMNLEKEFETDFDA